MKRNTQPTTLQICFDIAGKSKQVLYIKPTITMDVLKCKTVDGVLKELLMFALIYNLVRQVILSAAEKQNVDVKRLSFIDALRWLQSADRGVELNEIFVNPHRPDRYDLA